MFKMKDKKITNTGQTPVPSTDHPHLMKSGRVKTIFLQTLQFSTVSIVTSVRATKKALKADEMFGRLCILS